MPDLSRYILFSGIAVCVISVLYFLCLVSDMPFIATGILTLIAVAASSWWFFKRISSAPEPLNIWAIAAVVFGLYFIVSKADTLAEPHGAWDAWAIWNLHAKYLSDAANWKSMFLNTQFSHPDYPLAQPAFIAFCHNIFGNSALIPFIFSCFITMSIPILIFSETWRKNLVVAIVALLLIAQNESFIRQGTSQYADTLLAFFFLLAIVCIYHDKDNRTYVLLSAFFAASCLWVKNEGMVLAAIFVLFNIDTFFSTKNIKPFLAGIAIPLATVIFFKAAYAPGNDMLEKQADVLSKLKEKARYKLVYEYFKKNVDNNLYWVKISVLVYGLFCGLQQRLPDRQMLMLLTCLVAYMGIYVITPNDLDWHLRTSQDRLLHQLMPALVFVMAQRFSEIRSTLFKQQLL